jgi:transposase-like protein
MRNALAHSGKRGRRVVSAFVATAFAQDDADSAKQQWRRVADQLRPKVPKLAALMDEAEPDVLAYMTFPQQHRAKLHSTNPLERLNGEISAAPRSSASFRTRPPSPAWSGRSCSSRTMNGPSSAPAT